MTKRFQGTLPDAELSAARLLVSELVTNAVLHGQGRITFRALLDEDRLRVDVLDQGVGPEAAVRDRDFEHTSSGGRGLFLVDAESSRWGVHRDTGCVWFELERPGPRTDRSGPGRE